jgi:hypothetical protein
MDSVEREEEHEGVRRPRGVAGCEIRVDRVLYFTDDDEVEFIANDASIPNAADLDYDGPTGTADLGPNC